MKQQYKIELRKIDYNNLWKITKLHVTKEQEEFVATNTESILQAYVAVSSDRYALPFGIYADDELVGFVMFGYGKDEEDDPEVAVGNYCIWRFMTDVDHQHKGYGRAAIPACLDYLRTMPVGPAQKCWLDCEPENVAAKTLYESFGFHANGEMCDEAIVMERDL